MTYELKGRKVWVPGHRGMVGSAVVRRLGREDCEIITASRTDLDLTDTRAVHQFTQRVKPDVVILAAAKVGGILANDTYPVDFLAENLAIEMNIINAAHRADINRLVFLGSSCIYPKFAENPIREEALLTGPLEPTNEWYAIAKIAGIKLCQAYRKQYGRDYISCMPTNLYGPNDNFDLQTSHVLAALVAKAHAAKSSGKMSMELWGTGKPLREFMHVDDCADAIVFVTRHYSNDIHINIGSGEEVSILQLAQMVQAAADIATDITFDLSKPDGTVRKLMDSSRLRALGWKPSIPLKVGLPAFFRWYADNIVPASLTRSAQ